MKKRKIKLIWTCSDYVYHEHKYQFTAWACGRIQYFFKYTTWICELILYYYARLKTALQKTLVKFFNVPF